MLYFDELFDGDYTLWVVVRADVSEYSTNPGPLEVKGWSVGRQKMPT